MEINPRGRALAQSSFSQSFSASLSQSSQSAVGRVGGNCHCVAAAAAANPAISIYDRQGFGAADFDWRWAHSAIGAGFAFGDWGRKRDLEEKVKIEIG